MSVPDETAVYAALHRGNPGDVAFYRDACADVDSVLELGCGAGRIVAALVAPGRAVVGLERSASMLALARRATRDLRPRPTLVHGDMIAIDLPRTFARIVIPHCGLYCLPTRAAVRACLRGVAAHLRPGGRLVLDAWAADAFHEEGEPHDGDEPVALGSVTVQGEDYEVVERSRWVRARQRIDVEYTLTGAGGGPVLTSRVRHHYWTAAQLVADLEAVGLHLRRLDGGFDGELYDDDAELMVVVAERPVGT